jgi:hypothetical protein
MSNIKGVSPDAEIVVNEHGGKQSKTALWQDTAIGHGRLQMRKCKMCGIEVGARRQFCDDCRVLRAEEYNRRQNERRRKTQGRSSVFKWDLPRETIQPKVSIIRAAAEAKKAGLSYGYYMATGGRNG